MRVYRRRPKSDTWHFHPACRWYPKTSEHGERVQKPTSGELCNECLRRETRSK